MAVFTRRKFSASSNGEPVTVVATATAGTPIHVATATAGDFDEIVAWAVNTHTADVQLTVEAGSTGDPLVFDLPFKGGAVPLPIATLDGGVTYAAFASIANVVRLQGHVNRIAA